MSGENSGFTNRSRRIARKSFWAQHDRDTYQCPDCGRGEESILDGFEVHHINGEPMDNREDNLVALCRVCHCLREGKKPSIDHIEALRDSLEPSRDGGSVNDPTHDNPTDTDTGGGYRNETRSPPVNEIDRIDSTYMVVEDCVLCGRTHRHGTGEALPPIGAEEGQHRVSHCNVGGGPSGYYLVRTEDTVVDM